MYILQSGAFTAVWLVLFCCRVSLIFLSQGFLCKASWEQRVSKMSLPKKNLEGGGWHELLFRPSGDWLLFSFVSLDSSIKHLNPEDMDEIEKIEY